MKKIYLISLLLGISVFISNAQTIPTDSLYLGQTPSGDSAILFAPEVLTGSNNNISQMAFSPKGDELYYGVYEAGGKDNIYHIKYENNAWSASEVFSLFSDKKTNLQIFSADGSKLYFSVWNADWTSNIYMIERTDEGWSEAQKLPSPINSAQSDFCYSETNDGVAYISSNRPGSSGTDIWKISMNSDLSYKAEKLGSEVNSSNTEMLPCVAPDGSYLIFSTDRPNGSVPQSLFISFKKENNEWTTPIDMEESGAKINVPNYHQNCPTLSPDGKYLFFGRHSANGVEPFTINTYWVSTSVIDDLKKIAFTIPADSLYFGQTPPGDTPEKFAPGIITGYVHGRIAISPKGDEIFWVTNPSTERIYYSMYNNDSWSASALAPFTRNLTAFNNGNPTFSPNGERVYFYSDKEGGMGSYDTWYAERADDGWTEPINVGAPYNTTNLDFSPLFTNTGNAYYLGYSSTYETVALQYKFNDSIFSAPTTMETLPEYGPWLSLFFSAEDDYLIFAKGENADLYVRFKNSEGVWGTPISLGDKINSNQWERFPVISPDGKYLFFTRGNSTVSDLYWVSTSVIEELRNPSSTSTLLNNECLKIYPNPASHEIRIEGLSQKEAEFQFIRIDGSIQKQGVLKSSSIDIASLTHGTYLLRLEYNDKLFTKQIVIH